MVSPAYPVATVAAHVKEGMELALCIATEQDRILTHVIGNKVVRVRYLAFMSNEQPAAPEYLLQLLVVDVSIGKYAPVHQASLIIYQSFCFSYHLCFTLF